MIKFSDDYSERELKELGLCLEDLFEMQSLLTDEEFAVVEPIVSDKARVARITTFLNDRKALPKDFKLLVRKWSGYEGIYEREEINY